MVDVFSSLGQLDKISDKISLELEQSDSGKLSRILGFQVSLLEVFDHELKKQESLGYCDFELAYVSYKITVALYERVHLQAGKLEFVEAIYDLIKRKEPSMHVIVKFIAGHSKSQPKSDPPQSSMEKAEDLLLQRFQRLTTAPNVAVSSDTDATSTTKTKPIESVSPLVKFKYKECVSVSELHELLSNSQLSQRVLLIDFRTRKEYDYNHINYSEIVQIDPSWVNGLDNKCNDQDLEQRLHMLMNEDEFKRFQRRNTYELIVIYNLKFGPISDNRFDSLKELLLSGDKNGVPSSSPFNKLISFITFKNKYLSSRLKRHPVYLGGGVSQWFSKYGEKSITKTVSNNGNGVSLIRPEATMSRTPDPSRRNSYTGTGQMNGDLLKSRSNSPYLMNFSDYISTATSQGVPATTSYSQSNNLSYNSNLALGKVDENHEVNTTSSPHISRRSSSIGSSIDYSLSRSRSNSASSSSASNIVNQATTATALLPVVANNSNSKSSGNSPIKFLEQYTTGLTNLGNSCYMNCVLQCIGATPQLTSFFFPSSLQSSYRQHINVNNKLGSKGILTTTFVTLLTNMFTNNGKFFTPTNFKKVIGSLSPGGQFASFDQQDCIEFLNFVLDGLHEDLNQMAIRDSKEKQSIMELTPEQERTREMLPVRLASTIEWERYLKLNFSIIVDYFQGQYLSQLKCLECGLTLTTYNAFLILSLPIPEKLCHGNTTLTLDDLMKEFVTTELLDNENKWHCPRCKKFTKLTKKISITRLPQVLIIHFKRFKISNTGYFDKLNTMIKYPVNDTLDLTSYWPEAGTNFVEDVNQRISKEKEEQILSTLPTRNQKPPFRYKLYGVVNHFGTLSTGHYTSYVHKESDSKKKREWCYFDDAKVTYNCKESQVLNSNAYCLFYQRI